MDIDYKYIKEKISQKEVSLEQVFSGTIFADPLTK